MTPATHPGLLGICLSGAGPTILALVDNSAVQVGEEGIITTDSSEISLGSGMHSVNPYMQQIGEAIKGIWSKAGIEVEWMQLDVDFEGANYVEIL